MPKPKVLRRMGCLSGTENPGRKLRSGIWAQAERSTAARIIQLVKDKEDWSVVDGKK